MDWKRMFAISVFLLAAFAVRANAGPWVLDANAGVGIPTGTFSDAWKSGLMVGGALDYHTGPLALGFDLSYVKNSPSADFQDALDVAAADDDFRFVHYGGHMKWYPETHASVSPYLGIGAGAYHVKESYTDPTLSEDISETAFGINVGGGLNYWISRSWGLGFDASYHDAFVSQDRFGTDSAPFVALSAGFRWKLSNSSSY